MHEKGTGTGPGCAAGNLGESVLLDLNCGLFQGMFKEGNFHCLVYLTQMSLEIQIKRKQNRLKYNLTRSKISIEDYLIFQIVMLSFLLKIV